MPEFIDDVAAPAGAWTRAPLPARPAEIWLANRGPWPVLVKKALVAPTTTAGAIPLAPGERRGPEDLAAWALDLWLLAPVQAGVVGVEARWAAPV